MREDILRNSDGLVGRGLIQQWGNPDAAMGCPYPAQLLLRMSSSNCVCVCVCVKQWVLSSQQSKAFFKAIYNRGFCSQTGLLPPLAYL